MSSVSNSLLWKRWRVVRKLITIVIACWPQSINFSYRFPARTLVLFSRKRRHDAMTQRKDICPLVVIATISKS
jgi:hypothetical protein